MGVKKWKLASFFHIPNEVGRKPEPVYRSITVILYAIGWTHISPNQIRIVPKEWSQIMYGRMLSQKVNDRSTCTLCLHLQLKLVQVVLIGDTMDYLQPFSLVQSLQVVLLFVVYESLWCLILTKICCKLMYIFNLNCKNWRNSCAVYRTCYIQYYYSDLVAG